MTASTPLSPTARSTPNRTKHRTVTERSALYDVLDVGLICHLGIVVDGAPVVLPTGYGRDGDTLYLHGSTGARSLRTAASGVEVCATVTLLDGIVYARSLMHHSMNYRSVVVHGAARPVTERVAKLHALEVITEHLAPGSWRYAREVNAREFAAVAVLALDLSEASVKIRAGDPVDDQEDIDANAAWAGVLPLRQELGEPVAASDLAAAIPVPAHIAQRTGATNAALGTSGGAVRP
ncbi:MAG: pyridoxamine 5'-phosphate oxidase family protein [Haloechinothrix sp.]